MSARNFSITSSSWFFPSHISIRYIMIAFICLLVSLPMPSSKQSPSNKLFIYVSSSVVDVLLSPFSQSLLVVTLQGWCLLWRWPSLRNMKLVASRTRVPLTLLYLLARSTSQSSHFTYKIYLHQKWTAQHPRSKLYLLQATHRASPTLNALHCIFQPRLCSPPAVSGCPGHLEPTQTTREWDSHCSTRPLDGLSCWKH